MYVVAHSIFGVPQTINSANLVYFLAMERVLALGNPRCMDIFTSECCRPAHLSAPPPPSPLQSGCWTSTVARARTSTGAMPTSAPARTSTWPWSGRVSRRHGSCQWSCDRCSAPAPETGGLFSLAVDLLQLFSENTWYELEGVA